MAFLDETGATILANEVKTYVSNTAVAKETGKGLSTNDYTTPEKIIVGKLGESEEGTLTFNGSEIKTNTDVIFDTLAEAQAAVNAGEVEDGASVYVKEGSGDQIKIADIYNPGIVKPDGETITIDTDGTIHGSSNVDIMTGATSNTNGISGTVPAPQAGQENLFLRGDGTWAKPSGGGASITPKPTVNPKIKNDNMQVIITWEDPTDVVYDGATLSKWAGTKLVMKESGYPTSPDDGILLVDNTVRDTYKENGFIKTNLTNDSLYYFTLFPYSTDGVYNYDSGNRLLGEPTELKIVTFADGTDEEIIAMIQAHYDDKINISDYWAVGDTRSVSLSAMSATGVRESHRAQTVQFVIGDFEHDDLTTAINSHTKAAITLLQKDCLMDAANASNPTNGSGNTENGYMNSSNTNVGGWKNCARRTWCNNVYLSALPSAWQSMVKTVNKKVSVGNNSSTIETVQDEIFLAAEIEIFGSTTYSFAGEGTQYQYYKNATANRYKMPKWGSSNVSNIYWERSPYSGNAAHFCLVNASGDASNYIASLAYGVAPCLCI